jgi:hypothetical protein
MRPQLNHSIVWCRDKVKSAGFLNQVLGLPDSRPFMYFLIKSPVIGAPNLGGRRP